MEIKKVVMPGVAPVTPQVKPVGVVAPTPVVKPAGVQPVAKPAPAVAQTPYVEVKPVTVNLETGVSTPSVTEIPKDERIADVKAAVEKVKSKSSTKKAKAESEDEDDNEETETKPTKKKFSGPRKVVVYGRELFVEEDSNVTLEQIRERIVSEYEFPEFSKERTQMSLDEASGIVVPVISFQKKG